MDDSFGTIIYVIIALVAFIISALGKKKKRDAKRTAPANTNYNKKSPLISNIGRLLNEELGIQNHDVFGDNYEENYEEEEIEEKEVVLDVVPPEMLDEKKDLPYSIEFDDTSEIFAKSITDSEIKPEEENSILEEFDLQKAVIYSEIITQKYF